MAYGRYGWKLPKVKVYINHPMKVCWLDPYGWILRFWSHPHLWWWNPSFSTFAAEIQHVESFWMVDLPKTQNQTLVLNFPPFPTIFWMCPISQCLLPCFFFPAGLWSAELRPAAALWCCGVYLRALEGTIQESTGHLADFEADFGPFWQNFGRIYDDCCRRLLFLGLDLWLWQHPSAEKSQPGAWGVGFPNWVPKFMAVLGLKLMIICWRGQAWQISADWQSLNSKRWNSNFIGEGDDFPDLDLLGRDIPMTYHKMEETWQFLMRLGISWN